MVKQVLDNKRVSAVLQEVALLLELKGENPFKVKAYSNGVAIELNTYPYRLDMDWRWCKNAKEKGAKIAMNPEAHDEEGLKDIYYGVGSGRKGWLELGDILNAMDFGETKAFLKRRKSS